MHTPCSCAWAVGDPGLPAALWRFTLSLDGRGTRLAQWMQLGPGPSGLSLAIDARPDKEQQLVRAEHPVPVYLATLSPKMLQLTGQVADAWLGTSFVPEGAKAAYFDHLDAGLAAADRTRAGFDVCQGAEVAIFDDEDQLHRYVDSRKQELAFSLGGMGSGTTNFYNDTYRRQGWSDVAADVQQRWQAVDRDGAAAAVTNEMVLATTLIGTEAMVRERLGVWRRAGVDTVRLYPAGETLGERLDTLDRAIQLVHEVETER